MEWERRYLTYSGSFIHNTLSLLLMIYLIGHIPDIITVSFGLLLLITVTSGYILHISFSSPLCTLQNYSEYKAI